MASASLLKRVRYFLIVLLLVFKCLTAVPIDDKVNRDMEKPLSPPNVDSRPQTGHIIRAHDVLRKALNVFPEWKDTNWTLCLDKLRKKREPYLDELGRVITGYKTIFELVLKQVEEVSNNNYAVSQFDNDRHDLCSIARYLSHQEAFSDRQNIISKMGEALGSECDPCIRYKRKNYNELWSLDIASEIEAEEKCKQKGKPSASSTTSATTIIPTTTTSTKNPIADTTIITKSTENPILADIAIVTTSTENPITASTKISSNRPATKLNNPPSTTSTISHPASIISMEMTKVLLEKLCSHQYVDVRLRNFKTKELLYSEEDEFVVDDRRRRIFTRKDLEADVPGQSGASWSEEELWRFEPVDQCSSSTSYVSVLVRSMAPNRPPKEYLFADSSDGYVYLRRGLQDSDFSGVTTALGASSKWHLMAKVADGYRGDICELGNRVIKGFVLRNEKYGAGYLNGDDDDIFEEDSAGNRRNVYLAKDISAWEILPDLSATYHFLNIFL